MVKKLNEKEIMVCTRIHPKLKKKLDAYCEHNYTTAAQQIRRMLAELVDGGSK